MYFYKDAYFQIPFKSKKWKCNNREIKKYDKVLHNDLIVIQFMLGGGKVKIVYTPQSCFYKSFISDYMYL